MKLRTICLFLGTTLLAGCSEDDLTGTSLQELGTPAPSPILAIDKEPAGSHCDAGGTKITSGIDKNGNGKLESSEVAKTQYVCNGDDGDDGEDGKNGKNGKNGKDGKDGKDGNGRRC